MLVYIKKLYLSCLGSTCIVEDLELKSVAPSRIEWLERRFEDEDIKVAVWELDKQASVLDRFMMAFFKEC